MHIAIVSKKEHASHCKAALEARGHTVTLLGGEANVKLGGRYDVLFARVCSSSHGAIDRVTSLRRNLAMRQAPRPLISFEESQTGMLKVVAELEQQEQAKAMAIAAKEAVASKEEKTVRVVATEKADTRPVRAGHHRGYVELRGKNYQPGTNWRIRRYEGPRKPIVEIGRYIGLRDGAQAECERLDALWLAEQAKPALTTKPAKPEPESNIFGATGLWVSKPTDPKAEPKVQESESPVIAEVSAESVDERPELPDEIKLMLLEVEKVLVDRGIELFDFERLHIRVTSLHLTTSENKAACRNTSHEGRLTSSLSQVTCKQCLRTNFYRDAAWVLSQLKA